MGYELLPPEGQPDIRASRDGGHSDDRPEASTSLDSSVVSSDGGALPVQVDAPPVEVDAQPVDVDGDTGTDTFPEWVRFDGGTFRMGPVSDGGTDVTVSSFEIARTEVTVAQYRRCVDQGLCSPPNWDSLSCFWNAGGHDDYPMTCIDWDQSDAFCTWAGGRLPRPAEWEYAARSGGRDNLYPWGNEPGPSCEYAVMNDGGNGCGTDGAMAVCSKPMGNTADGLCDMAGNVYEWVAGRTGRGGGHLSREPVLRTTADGFFWGYPYINTFIGVRCVRDVL
jgi:formylglycine-generating enzyme required for sulfatase activity